MHTTCILSARFLVRLNIVMHGMNRTGRFDALQSQIKCTNIKCTKNATCICCLVHEWKKVQPKHYKALLRIDSGIRGGKKFI